MNALSSTRGVNRISRLERTRGARGAPRFRHDDVDPGLEIPVPRRRRRRRRRERRLVTLVVDVAAPGVATLIDSRGPAPYADVPVTSLEPRHPDATRHPPSTTPETTNATNFSHTRPFPRRISRYSTVCLSLPMERPEERSSVFRVMRIGRF